MAKFSVESSTFKNGDELPMEHVFNEMGCTGQNIMPNITWQNVPEGTKSLAFTVYDPDAPTGSGWWHFVAVNIPANINSSASIPNSAMKIKNDFGIVDYGGACPPKGHGKHRYIFAVYALNVEKLDIDPSSSPALAGYNINQHLIQKAEIIAYYQR